MEKNKEINLKKRVTPYTKIDEKRSWIQVFTTLIPFFILCLLSYHFLKISFWLSLPFSLLGGLFMVRGFIIMHDCGHGTMFRSRRVRDFVGTVMGVMTSTPYKQWTREHAAHHRDSGNLDKRGRGDVWVMTLAEYQGGSFWEKLQYILYRHPLITFGIGPLYIFQIRHRFCLKTDRPQERRNLYFTNIVLALLVVGLGLWIGFKNFALLFLPMVYFAELCGCLLFYVQHQYEDVYWRKSKQWDYSTAALKGCSYLKLPKVLQWFSGSIGFHHIHHLNHKIPNYNLEACYDENEILRHCKVLTLRDIIPCIRMKLYDESQGKLLTWAQARQRLKESEFQSSLEELEEWEELEKFKELRPWA